MTGQALTTSTGHGEAIRAAMESKDAGALRLSFADWANQVSAGAVRERRIGDGLAVLEIAPGRELSHDVARRLLAGVERVLVPVDQREIVQAATQCLTVTASRERGQHETAALIAAMAEDLAGNPRDVVLTAFREWRRRNKFWPTVAELLELCQAQTAWRRGLKAMCERALAAPAPEPMHRYADLTDEQRAALDAKIAAAFETLKSDRPASPASVLPDVSVPMPRPAVDSQEAPQWPL